jgi:hypothetical protein
MIAKGTYIYMVIFTYLSLTSPSRIPSEDTKTKAEGASSEERNVVATSSGDEIQKEEVVPLGVTKETTEHEEESPKDGESETESSWFEDSSETDSESSSDACSVDSASEDAARETEESCSSSEESDEDTVELISWCVFHNANTMCRFNVSKASTLTTRTRFAKAFLW